MKKKMNKVRVYIKEYIGEFDSIKDAEMYLNYNHYSFDEETQPIFEEVESEEI